ncbi:NAD(P)H-dependent flavin oxidoreductase [Brevibacillus dissolubilis]|uniref:NAD(P)H-dependent flavin oxidoreductase n=1 Tax=Brevibacillus dissolubilis TaxID=1844116 RepID=UPI0011179C34|nr:nitronate monooxygenase [Brevibacillus dissolubilis]
MKSPFTTRFCEQFGIEKPIVLAGMAGNITSPELVAAVSEAGGLGTLGGAYMSADALRQAIRRIQELTTKPFAVNLLLYDASTLTETPVVSDELVQWLNQMRHEVGLEAWNGELPTVVDDLDDCFQVILDEGVPVFSCAFSLPNQYGTIARERGMKLIGMATTLDEALALQAQGVDAIVAQGGEAGGHRGTYQVGKKDNGACIGTLPLVGLVSEALPDLPIIAAGGIMDGRGMVAALSLGADAVQLGTRFLACEESTAHASYKARLLEAKETEPAITRAFSGRPARGLSNRMLDSFAQAELSALPYPIQNALTREIRQAAARRGDANYMSLWAGQGVAQLREPEPAREIVETIMREAQVAARRIQALQG